MLPRAVTDRGPDQYRRSTVEVGETLEVKGLGHAPGANPATVYITVDQGSARRASPAVLQLLILGFRPPPAQEAGQVRCPDGRTHQMGGFSVKIVLQHRGGAAE